MTPLEVGHRVLRALQAQAERHGAFVTRHPPPPALKDAPRPWIRVPRVDAAPYVAAAERIAHGWLDVFALKNLNLGSPPRWNRDPKTGIEGPLAFGKLVDYRDPDVVGDCKYLWEPNRHMHLVTLAQACALTGQKKYFDTIAEHLESWWLAAPYPLGANWSSALEPAIRLINWSLAWQLLGGLQSRMFTGKEDFRDRWLASVYQHCEFVSGWFSRHSSANNHLIGEAAGLFFGALTWPHWRRSRRWLAASKRILERETLLQNAPDGVNREQAVAYQQYELDLLVLCLLAGRAHGQWFSPAYEARIESMLDFIVSIMDVAGQVPMFGDSDDGYVVRLDASGGFCPYRSILATGALLFGRGDFKRKSRALDDKTRWLLGPEADAKYEALDPKRTWLPPRQQFPEGGYYVLGCEFDTPNEIRVVADAGPLGYRSIAAHGHADALSLTLSVGGREFLIDPGTYAYHTQGRWRQYFRGTAAHNTIRVDGVDQSEPGGNFMWLRHARAGCSLWLSSAERDCFEGWHTGYARLPDPVKHRRLIELDKRARRLVLEDHLEMEDAHEVELFFHFSERCAVLPGEGPARFVVSHHDAVLHIELPQMEGAQVELHHGSVAPIAGWVSRSFDCRTPASTLVWRARLAGNTSLRTEMALPTVAEARLAEPATEFQDE